MEDKEMLDFMAEFSRALDGFLDDNGFGEYKNGNAEMILEGDSISKERYLLVKEARERIVKSFNELKDKQKELEANTNNIVKWEKATGGEVIHRGFYNPSLVADIVIGRNGRGKLLKRPTAKSKITYEYGFDEGGKMVKAVTHTEVGDLSEYFIRENDKALAVCYDADGQTYSVCEEFYSGEKIKSFTIAFFDGMDRPSIVQHEYFEYDGEGQLFKSEMLEISVLSFKKERPDNVTHRIYVFKTDGEGYLTKYNMMYDESLVFERDDQWFDIKLKRKA